jgi:CheY-like chemotaxis protein
MTDLVVNVVKMLSRVLGDEIVVQQRFGSEIPQVLADRGMMEQLLMNLAVNARDAMPKGGTLTVAIQQVSVTEKDLKDAEARAGNFVCLSIQDTGTGISAENLPHIFEPFFTTKDVGKGTGLGLATVYGIVKQHHGWIQVSSVVGRTEFKIYLPSHSQGRAEQKSKELSERFIRGKETIFVVEDEPALRRLVTTILKGQGYRIYEAASGKEALAIFASVHEPIHLLLTDITMPHGISGLELAEKLKQQLPELKVLFTSGYSLELGGKSISPTVDYLFLPKPYSPVVLTQMVRTALDAIEVTA